ncbi:MAG: SusC/RagA family TonB-linked outer membrane protein [Gemmatimonadetes bacterium]|nr:SusC/RagA family TonB-linked outer membrane protein [Gemmatimonadota bacterium]
MNPKQVSSRKLFSAAAVAAMLLGIFGSAHAQEGAIRGRVIDQATLDPVAMAQVFVAGTNRSALTNQEGEYTITGISPGQHTVRVAMIGYAATSAAVTVGVGETAVVDFQLTVSAIPLEGLVVNAVTGQTQRRREMGNTVGTISVAELDKGPVTNVADVLTSRAAGVSVVTGSGTTGAGARVRIRGGGVSVSLDNSPLVIVDGTRINNGSDFDLFTGGQNFSRLNDINPEDIENIEVLKGPAASALYGTAAANGVIQITTKRGRPGPARWNFYGELGGNFEVTNWPANYRGVAADGSTCNIFDQSEGLCTLDQLESFSPLEDERTSPFRDGVLQKYGLSVAGGGNDVTYFLAGEFYDEKGVYDVNRLERQTLRANISAQLTDEIDANVSIGYITSEGRLPDNDNNLFSYILNGMLGGSEFDPEDPDAVWFFFPPSTVDNNILEQEIDRVIGSVNASWRPLDWLTFSGVAGIDYLQRHDNNLILPEKILFGDATRSGYVDSNRFKIVNWTGNLSTQAVYPLTDNITATSTAGLSYERARLTTTEGFGAGLTPGTSSLGATSRLFAVDEDNTDVVTMGGFVRQQVGYKDRVFLSAALRGDDNSAFGADFGLVTYPALQASWVIGEEPWFPTGEILSSLRVRGAYGRSGQRPDFRDAETFFNPVSVAVDGDELSALVVGGTGNVNLEPEKTDEFEFGFDAGLLNERLSLLFTFYTKNTQDLLVAVPLAPSLGEAATRFANLGESNSRGIELGIEAGILDSEQVKWDASLNVFTVRSELKELGEGIEPIVFGLGGDSQRHEEGYPLGGYWQRPIESFEDANSDGIITPDEVVVGDEPVFLDYSFPQSEITFSTEVTLFKYIQARALFERRAGFSRFNDTEFFRCAQSTGFFRCREAFDPDAPLEDQARIAARFTPSATRAGYIEEADFTRWRELSITFTAPPQWARIFRASGVSLTISGRNLALWTDYRGQDPEVITNTGGSTGEGGTATNWSTADFFTQPPVRTWTLRLDLSY